MNTLPPPPLHQTIYKNRLVWIDFLKGLAILFVVLGHFTYSKDNIGIKNLIYSFHMPLFFMLAGCTAAISLGQSKSLSSFYKKRCISVFIPYSVWCFAGGLPFACTQEYLQYDVISRIHTFICGDVMQWFLICLFLLQSLYALFKWITIRIPHSVFKLCLIFLLYILIYLLHHRWGKSPGNTSHISIDFLTNIYYFYWPFVIGCTLIEYPSLFKKIFQHRLFLLVSVLVSVFYVMLSSDFPIFPGIYTKVAVGICVAMPIIHLVKDYDFASAHKIVQILTGQIILFGKYTMVIYLFHGYMLPKFTLPTNVWGVGMLPFMIMVAIAIAICYTCVVLDRIISQSPICALLLLGKTQRS